MYDTKPLTGACKWKSQNIHTVWKDTSEQINWYRHNLPLMHQVNQDRTVFEQPKVVLSFMLNTIMTIHSVFICFEHDCE